MICGSGEVAVRMAPPVQGSTSPLRASLVIERWRQHEVAGCQLSEMLVLLFGNLLSQCHQFLFELFLLGIKEDDTGVRSSEAVVEVSLEGGCPFCASFQKACFLFQLCAGQCAYGRHIDRRVAEASAIGKGIDCLSLLALGLCIVGDAKGEQACQPYKCVFHRLF